MFVIKHGVGLWYPDWHKHALNYTFAYYTRGQMLRRNNIKIGIPRCRPIVLFIHQDVNITRASGILPTTWHRFRAILGSDCTRVTFSAACACWRCTTVDSIWNFPFVNNIIIVYLKISFKIPSSDLCPNNLYV